jgi:hypothetical protein
VCCCRLGLGSIVARAEIPWARTSWRAQSIPHLMARVEITHRRPWWASRNLRRRTWPDGPHADISTEHASYRGGRGIAHLDRFVVCAEATSSALVKLHIAQGAGEDE